MRTGVNALRDAVMHICRLQSKYGAGLVAVLPSGLLPALTALNAVCGLFSAIGIIDVE